MEEPIRIIIAGRAPETDAPSVDDLLEQVRDYLEILRGVERAVSSGESDIEWRVTGATKNSPLVIELTPFPRKHGTNISSRVSTVRNATGRGLSLLRERGERPLYFTDGVLDRAQRVFERVTNGLSNSVLEVGGGNAPVVITPVNARAGAEAVRRLRKPADQPYSELGSIECTFLSLERDGFGRPLLHVRHRLDGAEVKCILQGSALAEIERQEVAHLWSPSQRMRLFGTIHYRSLGRIRDAVVDAVEFIPATSSLPSAEDIIDPDFTGGVPAAEHLRRLRGEVS